MNREPGTGNRKTLPKRGKNVEFFYFRELGIFSSSKKSQREHLTGNRESGIGNRESGIGNRESGIGNRKQGTEKLDQK